MVPPPRALRTALAHRAATVSYRRQRVHARTDASRTRRAQVRGVRRAVPRLRLARAGYARGGTAEWKGLGYNSRAVRLRHLAQSSSKNSGGNLPREHERLRALPGIGPYTAAAIRAFAFDIDDAPIDTNVRRLVNRLFFGLEYPHRAAPRELDARARELVPPGRAHDWNSALMDLGSCICTARAPKCLLCPLRSACAAAPVDAGLLERLRAAAGGRRSPQNAIPFEHTTRYARGRILDRLRDLPPGRTDLAARPA